MRTFQGYTANTMLDEYALRFYTLLEQSLKLDALDFVQKATIASIPYMEDSDRKKLMDSYERSGRDIIEDIRDAANTDGIDALKEQFK